MDSSGNHQLLFAERLDVVRQSEFLRAAAGARQFRTIAHQQQPRRQPLADAAEQLDDDVDPLHRPEIGDVNHSFVSGSPRR